MWWFSFRIDIPLEICASQPNNLIFYVYQSAYQANGVAWLVSKSVVSTMKGRLMRRSLLRFLILILTTMDQMMLAPATHHGRHHRTSGRIHLSRAVEATKRFFCREPQLRAYNLRDIVHLQSSDSVNQPVYIMLKRCDSHAGCCVSPDLSCALVQSSVYHEEIEIEVWSLVTNSTRRVWIRVEQHGRCACEIMNTSEKLRAVTQPPNIEILWFRKIFLRISIWHWGKKVERLRVRRAILTSDHN